MSMYFLHFVSATFLATFIAAWSSTINGDNFVSGCITSSSVRLVHCVCCVACDSTRYSASHVDIATVDCRDYLQVTGALLNV